MSKLWTYLRGLVGNSKPATIGILVFILILIVLASRCSVAKGAEVDLRPGVSFGHSSGPVLGLRYLQPIAGLHGANVYVGTLLWGTTATEANNWSWEGGLRACRWSLCASLGAAYLQRIDALNGAHTNFNLELSYLLNWHRVSSIDVSHLSDAGTTPINVGRQAALVSIRLQ
ncbi:MAG: hypothetical protein ACREQ5_03790 [Candidatus Dormibacteria bacterium]